MRGWFIAFEGGEACGKTTQARLLADHLGAVLTREPGGTALGERIRALVLDPAHHVDPRSEALLMAAARAQHVAEVIEPALAAGRPVVSDRFTGSSLAYQGVARGLGVEKVAALSHFATAGLQPDVVVLIDVPAPVAAARLAAAGAAPDRMEREPGAFHDRVATGFRSLAAADPGRWRVVAGGGSVDEVAALVASAVREVLPAGWVPP